MSERNPSDNVTTQVTRWYAALGGVTRAAVVARSREEYPAEVTRVLVEEGRFAMASVHWHDPATHELKVIARWGDGTGYTDRIRMFSDLREEGLGPGGRAFRLGSPVITGDFLNDPATLPWHEEARRAGWRASAAIPIRVSGESRGLLSIYAGEAGFFGPSEVDLLQRVADDIGFVMRSFDREDERRKGAAALAENERRLKMAMEAAGVGIFDWDLRTGRIVWDGHSERMFGLEPGGYDGTYATFEKSVFPEDLAGVNDVVARARATRTAYSHEFRIVWPDGSIHWVAALGEFFYDESGEPFRLCGVALDTDRRKRNEQALLEAEERFRHALDGMFEGCMLIDFDWRYLYVNEAAAKHGMKRSEELVGRRMQEMYPGVENSNVFARYRECMEQRVPQRFDEEYIFPAGARRWYEFSVTPVPEGIFVMSLDITERRQAEERRRIADSLIETSHDFIGIATLDGEATYLNHAGKVMVGLEDFEPGRGVTVYDFVPPEDLERLKTNILAALQRDGWVRTEGRLRNFRTGQAIPAEIEAILIRNAEGNPICQATVTRDLTERRAAEQHRAQLETQLAQAQKMEALGRLTGGIAHDFNNSLTVISGYAEMLASSKNLSPDDRDAVAGILNAGTRSRNLVKQLMGFSRQQVIRPRPLDLNRTLAESRPILARLVGENVQLRTVPGANLWDVLLDSTQVDQVLMNLVANARDAMPEGGKLTIETSNVAIGGASTGQNPPVPAGEYVLLTVSDTGIGMDAETALHVFEPFFTTREKGTGLGLATVYGIVRQNHGFIHLASEPGRGTTFRIYFPRLRGGAAEREEGAPGVTSKASRSILLVEDNELVRGMTAEALRHFGYRAMVAESATEAARMCEDPDIAIDLVISDVMLPEIPGPELRDRLEKLRPGLPVLFVSGYTANVMARQGILRPGTHFLQKPFSLEALGGKIESILTGIRE